MKKITTAILALSCLAAFATTALAVGPGPFYARGSYYNGWSADANNLMTLAGGVWSTGAVTCDNTNYCCSSPPIVGRHEYKVATYGWDESYGNCNFWVWANPGDQVHFTFDTNTYADGWLPASNILWNDHYAPPGTVFEVIGSAPETGSWGSGVASSLISGIWTRVLTIAAPNTYAAKFRGVGSWDLCNVGSEGFAPCGADYSYTTTVPNTDVRFEFNPATGRMRVDVLGPTPAANKTFGQVKVMYR